MGEFKWANGNIYKGSFSNDKFNGIGLKWLANGDLLQGNYKNDKRDGLHIIHLKATGNTADVEYQDDLKEGLYAEHTPTGIIWCTFSKN